MSETPDEIILQQKEIIDNLGRKIIKLEYEIRYLRYYIKSIRKKHKHSR